MSLKELYASPLHCDIQDTSLSTAVDHVGMYLRHVEAEKKTLKDKLDKLEKDFAKLKNK